MTCCGSERGTAFCPDCGAALREEGPLGELLRYCGRAGRLARKQELRYARFLEKPGLSEHVRGRTERQRDGHRARAVQWEAYAAALQDVLGGG